MKGKAGVKGMVALAAGLLALGAQAGPMSGQGTWETTLQARDINGDMTIDAYYDTALDITWLADWNANGPMDWSTAADTWAAGLNVFGVTGWRLPTITDTGTSGCNLSFSGGTDCGYNVDTTGSELAHMWYVTLGNLAFCPPGDATCAGGPQFWWGLTNTANFVNVQSGYYWSGTEYAPNTSLAWRFSTADGVQNLGDKDNALFAVAVRAGDVPGATAVPEPGALGLLALGGIAMALRRAR
jgi:hypothetical protein